MSKILLESDFLTIDLSQIFKQSASNATENNTTPATNEVDEAKFKSKDFDWALELTKRKTEDEALPEKTKLGIYRVEQSFWNDFFKYNFLTNSIKPLMQIGEQLQSDIIKFGFKKESNPLLAFISLSYVQTELLQAGLLNRTTYKAIRDSWLSKLIADSELYAARDYNIIYCRDLYRKPASEIKEYFKFQNHSKLLSTKKTAYHAATQQRNRKVFLVWEQNTEKDAEKRIEKQLGDIPKNELHSVKDTNAKLNSLDFVQDLTMNLLETNNTKSDQPNKSADKPVQGTDQKQSLVGLTKELSTPAKVSAVLQYLVMRTGSSKAKSALTSEKLKNVTLADLHTATAQVTGTTSKLKLTKDEADDFALLLLDRL